nr:hypothetical protein CFP56_10344 [Quercus suber]
MFQFLVLGSRNGVGFVDGDEDGNLLSEYTQEVRTGETLAMTKTTRGCLAEILCTHPEIHICLLLLTSSLGGFGTALGVKAVVPPAERARVVADEFLMVRIVVIGAGPEGQEMVQTPRELVARMRVNGLEETQDDPDVHSQDVEVLGEGGPYDGATNGAGTEDHDFDRGCVFRREPERRGVLVVDLVDVLV